MIFPKLARVLGYAERTMWKSFMESRDLIYLGSLTSILLPYILENQLDTVAIVKCVKHMYEQRLMIRLADAMKLKRSAQLKAIRFKPGLSKFFQANWERSMLEIMLSPW